MRQLVAELCPLLTKLRNNDRHKHQQQQSTNFQPLNSLALKSKANSVKFSFQDTNRCWSKKERKKFGQLSLTLCLTSLAVQVNTFRLLLKVKIEKIQEPRRVQLRETANSSVFASLPFTILASSSFIVPCNIIYKNAIILLLVEF